MVETDMTKVFMGSEDENKEKQGSIVVPIDEDVYKRQMSVIV